MRLLAVLADGICELGQGIVLVRVFFKFVRLELKEQVVDALFDFFRFRLLQGADVTDAKSAPLWLANVTRAKKRAKQGT